MPSFEPLNGVVTLVNRNGWNQSQRAIAAARLSYQYARDAELRRKSGTKAPEGVKGKATARAAQDYGISTRLVELAKKVTDNAIPDLVRAVEEGKVSISDAAKVAKELPDVQRQALNAFFGGRAKTLTEAVELCARPKSNGQPAISKEQEAAAKLAHDQTCLADYCANGIALFDRLGAYNHRHPALSDAVQQLAAVKRAVDNFIRFPSPEAYRQHLIGSHVRT
jgi:hypothetical protein